MPSRNVVKIDVEKSYYHVYARGGSRQSIFRDDEDYEYFQSLFQRYLSIEEKHDRTGRPYVHLLTKLELLAYCLMPNHFHLMFYQVSEGSISMHNDLQGPFLYPKVRPCIPCVPIEMRVKTSSLLYI